MLFNSLMGQRREEYANLIADRIAEVHQAVVVASAADDTRHGSVSSSDACYIINNNDALTSIGFTDSLAERSVRKRVFTPLPSPPVFKWLDVAYLRMLCYIVFSNQTILCTEKELKHADKTRKPAGDPER